MNSIDNVSNPAMFNQVRSALMDTLIKKAAHVGNSIRFATGDESFTSFERVYCLVQCSPDIVVSDCDGCLRAGLRRKTNKKSSQSIQNHKSKDTVRDDLEIGNIECFVYNEVEEATMKFSAVNKLGQGGFGSVYKGLLRNGNMVAIKRLSRNSFQGIKEFKTEVEVVAKLQHKNLVRLVGFCVENEERILVFEYLPNLSLDRFLFDAAKSFELDWRTRYNIIEGIARGLRYLHIDSLLTIVHRDMKSSNILLDDEMNPKIADFGMAKLVNVHETTGSTSRIGGTL